MAAPQVVDTAYEPLPRPKRNPLARVTASHLLMVLAAALAFATNVMVLRSQDETRAIVVAARSVAAGRHLELTDLAQAQVDVEDELFATLIAWDQASALAGMVAARPIEQGQMLVAADLRSPAAPAGLRAISIPVDLEHAVGGDLMAGDRIDLIAVEGETSEYVLVGAEVLSVPTPSRGSLTGSGGFYVVVAVDAEQALAVAAAIRQGEIEVVRSTGSTGVHSS